MEEDKEYEEKVTEVLKKIRSREINTEQAFESLAELGWCPNLLNDDNGHWAVKFDGFQNVPMTDSVEDISTTFFIEAADWKDSIYEALLHTLDN